jgi:KamA family protein
MTTTAPAPDSASETLRRVRYITSIDRIEGLGPAERRALGPVADRYAFRLNDYYLNLIDWSDPNDPVRQLVIPRGEELDDYGALDASDEAANTVARGVQHKYADTALLLCNEVCGAYCRYCFRKRLFMNGNDDANNDVTEGLDYIREHREISNVLLTGGDPLLMSTRRIAEVLEALATIEHVRIVRIGSKMPAFDPWRLRRDPELQRVLRSHPRERQRLYLMAHFDHPRELTAEALAELEAWSAAGVTAVNQCPLIRGINDRPEVLAELWSRLSYAGCPPYYLFQGRPTAGNAPYEIPIVEGWSIFQQALARGSGLARRARFVMSHATGKVEVLAVDRTSIYLRYHQAKDPADLGRFLVAERDDRAGWLDELRIVDWTSANVPRRTRPAAPPWPLPRVPVEANSPLQLNDLGHEIAAEVHADEWAADVAPSLAERAAGEPPWKVDAFCRDYINNCLEQEMRDRVAETAYERGMEPEGVHAVLRVVLRNRLLGKTPEAPEVAAEIGQAPVDPRPEQQ